jgi:hypothetical protein
MAKQTKLSQAKRILWKDKHKHFIFVFSSKPNKKCHFKYLTGLLRFQRLRSTTHDNIIDWDMNKFDKKTNKSHHDKSQSCCLCNLGKFYKKLHHGDKYFWCLTFPVRLCAFLDQIFRVLDKLLERINDERIDVRHSEKELYINDDFWSNGIT